MQRVPDGRYLGSAQAALVRAQVAVEVKDHQMTQITLLRHDSGQARPAEAITGQMVAANRVDVDSVSGATVSSVVIKSAVLNALQSAQR